MKCPNCEIEMKLIQISSHYGMKIFADQCDRCGGVWFDEDEHFRAGVREYKKFKKIDYEKFKKEFKINSNLLCPIDGQKLNILEDKYFSTKIEVDYCPKCHGFWFNYGEFKEFQRERRKKIGRKKKKTSKEDEFEQKMDAMLRTSSVVSKYNTIGIIGKTLSKKVDTGKIINGFAGRTDNNPISNIIYGAFLIGTSILKIIASSKRKH